jgi:hypothetical protein
MDSSKRDVSERKRTVSDAERDRVPVARLKPVTPPFMVLPRWIEKTQKHLSARTQRFAPKIIAEEFLVLLQRQAAKSI